MTTWLIHRQWESLFAIAELTRVPALLWISVGALLLLTRAGRDRWGKVLRGMSTAGWIALAALIATCWLSAGLTADAVLAQQLRGIALQMGLNVLIGTGIAAIAMLLVSTTAQARVATREGGRQC
jgi:hypothetical protein